MINNTIKNGLVMGSSCGGGTTLQATYLNPAQETLQQLLASELTKQRSSIIAPKQGDMEQLAIELAQAVGSAFSVLQARARMLGIGAAASTPSDAETINRVMGADGKAAFNQGGITSEDVARFDMDKKILSRTNGGPRYPITWIIRMGDDDVQFARVVNGNITEDYAPVDNKKAGVYAAAILNGLEPPRHLQPSDKPD